MMVVGADAKVLAPVGVSELKACPRSRLLGKGLLGVAAEPARRWRNWQTR